MTARGTALAAALALALLPAPASALDPARALTQYRRDAWTTRDGLPQSSVEAIAQTADGYLWLGTQEGLARFDGVRFVVFDKANTRALRHNRVTALLADRDGSLWIGTEGGGVTRLREGLFSTLGSAQGLPNPRVRAFAQDEAGTVWVGTDGGLARLQGARVLPGPQGAGLATREVVSLLADADGLWVGLRDGLERVTGREVQAGAARGVPAVRVGALWEDRDRTLWIGTRRGLLVLRPGAAAVPADLPLPAPGVGALLRDRDQSLWVATESGVTRSAGGRTSAWNTRLGLPNDHVLRLFEDREGSVWIGMQDGGLVRLGNGKFVTYSTAEGLAGDIVWPVFGDREGNVWIGTTTGGLSRFRDGHIENFSTAQGLSNPTVQALAQTTDGALWVGTRGGGLDRYENGRFTASAAPGLPGESVSALLGARDGGLWVGTRGAGLCRLEAGVVRRCWTVRDGLTNDTIHFLLEAHDGSLWIATNGGGLLHLKDGVFRAYTAAKDGLSSDIVNVLHEDREGTLWVGTFGGGLNRMRGDRFVAYTTAEGLYDDAIFSILEDDDQRLWMSCNKGVFRVDKRDLDALDRKAILRLQPVAYGVEDGMKNRECNGANQPPAWRDQGGRLWFATLEGVVTIDPAHIPHNDSAPPVVIEEVRVDGKTVQVRDGLALQASVRNLEIQYAGPSFVAPERLHFRYRLEGHDPEWVDAGPRRTAYYTNLPPGSYRFAVSAANEDGISSRDAASVAFAVSPRVYQTPWFYAACALGVGGLVWSADRLRTRRLKAREADLERQVEERTRALEAAYRDLELLSSLDGLTGVANRTRFDEVLDTEWRRACRTGAPLSVILFDVDFFKSFNDTRGHLAGDECLRHVAAVLSESFGRAGDLVARFGGEEFIALLPGTGEAEAGILAERLRADIEALALPHGASPVSPVVTLSAGVATAVPTEAATAEGLLSAADAALYRAKRGGRNRVVGAAA